MSRSSGLMRMVNCALYSLICFSGSGKNVCLSYCLHMGDCLLIVTPTYHGRMRVVAVGICNRTQAGSGNRKNVYGSFVNVYLKE